MTPDEYDKLCRLMKKYRISFEGPVPQNQWPPSHRDPFRTIQDTCGRKEYDTYVQERSIRAVEEPWGADVVQRAARIVAKAERCLRENRNEAGWRLLLEPEIFNRFTVEVAW